MATVDLSVRTTCRHIVFRERVSLEDDGVTIRFPRPVASKRSVVIRLNGHILPSTKYFLVKDERSVDAKGLKAVLTYPFKGWMDAVVELDYGVSASNCRICHSLVELDDFSYSDTGTLVWLGDREKLQQDIDKIVVTVLGSNPFHTWYGTSVNTLIGKKISSSSFIATTLQGEIEAAMDKLLELQSQQEDYQTLSDGEVLLELEDVEISYPELDILRTDIFVRVRDLDSLRLTHAYKF